MKSDSNRAAVSAGDNATEWPRRRIGDLGRVIRGSSPRPAGDPRYFNGDFVPWLTVGAITNSPDYTTTVTQTETMLTAEGSSRSTSIKAGAVIMANSGFSLGVAKVLGLDCCANDGVAAILDLKSIEPRFLTYAINAQTERLRKVVSRGNDQPNLNIDIIQTIEVPHPALAQQHAIGAALSDVDALIGSLDALIAKKLDLKQAAMQQLLTGQTRLPGFAREWKEKRLGDVGRCLRGVSYKGDRDLSAHDTAQTKRLLRSNNVQNGVVVTSTLQFVSELRVSAAQILKIDDILVCMANGSKALVGKAGRFATSDGFQYTFGAFMGCFRTDETAADPVFVFSLFQTGKYREYVNNLLAGSSINNLAPGNIENLEFSFPSRAEQTAIAEVLSEKETEIAALESQRDKARAVKQGMMQELLTGRIRLI